MEGNTETVAIDAKGPTPGMVNSIEEVMQGLGKHVEQRRSHEERMREVEIKTIESLTDKDGSIIVGSAGAIYTLAGEAFLIAELHSLSAAEKIEAENSPTGKEFWVVHVLRKNANARSNFFFSTEEKAVEQRNKLLHAMCGYWSGSTSEE